jgi:hypothetical protein
MQHKKIMADIGNAIDDGSPFSDWTIGLTNDPQQTRTTVGENTPGWPLKWQEWPADSPKDARYLVSEWTVLGMQPFKTAKIDDEQQIYLFVYFSGSKSG